MFKRLLDYSLLGLIVLLGSSFVHIPVAAQGAGDVLENFETTLAELGYSERILSSPYDFTEYRLRLPNHWELTSDSYLEIDYSYIYNFVGNSQTPFIPSFFGRIYVIVDGEMQQSVDLRRSEIEQDVLRISLPIDILNDYEKRTHTIQIRLDASHICEVSHQAQVIISPTTRFLFTYKQLPLVPDLSSYLDAFYQNSFEPDKVRFVLPDEIPETDLSGALAISGKLGELTYGSGIAISGTTDLSFLDGQTGSVSESGEHLVVIGFPENNNLISELNDLGFLPVYYQERQLLLSGFGLSVLSDSNVITYTWTLKNDMDIVWSSLSLVSELPSFAQLENCTPVCSTSNLTKHFVSWSIPSLAPEETFTYTVEFSLAKVVTETSIDSTATLFNSSKNPINVNTIAPTLEKLTVTPEYSSVFTSSSPYLFIVDNQAVGENDGIVQIITSPWDQTKAILVVTGLTNEAVYKASRAMSFESRFPGLSGQFALIQDVYHEPDEVLTKLDSELFFSDLDYDDVTVEGISSEINYYFYLPVNWHLTANAHLKLRFSHSQVLTYKDSFLRVLFNREPVSTIALSEATAKDGILEVPLSASFARPGRINRITIQVEMRPIDRCTISNMWLTFSRTSQFYLEHQILTDLDIDLDLYPYPFSQSAGLSDVLFVLPDDPHLIEWENILRIGYVLGDLIVDSNIDPSVAMGYDFEKLELSDYHMIVVGRPSRNPILQSLNEYLPQPFFPGSDQIQQKLNDVILRLPSDVSLGYVQLLPSLWNESRIVLAVTGTSDYAVEQAARVLTEAYWRLRGDLALVRDDEVYTIDTSALTKGGLTTVVSAVVPELTPITPTPTLTSVPQVVYTPTSTASAVSLSAELPSTQVSLPEWTIYLVIGTTFAVLGILTFVFWQTRRKKKVRR